MTTVGWAPLPGFSGSLVRRTEEGVREERFGTARCLIKCRVTLLGYQLPYVVSLNPEYFFLFPISALVRNGWGGSGRSAQV